MYSLITQPQIPSLSITSSSLGFALAKATAAQDASMHPVPSHPVLSTPSQPEPATCHGCTTYNRGIMNIPGRSLSVRGKPNFTLAIASPRCWCGRLSQHPASAIFSFCWPLDLLQIRLAAAMLEEPNGEYLLLIWALVSLLCKTHCSCVSAVGTGYARPSRGRGSG